MSEREAKIPESVMDRLIEVMAATAVSNTKVATALGGVETRLAELEADRAGKAKTRSEWFKLAGAIIAIAGSIVTANYVMPPKVVVMSSPVEVPVAVEASP